METVGEGLPAVHFLASSITRHVDRGTQTRQTPRRQRLVHGIYAPPGLNWGVWFGIDSEAGNSAAVGIAFPRGNLGGRMCSRFFFFKQVFFFIF